MHFQCANGSHRPTRATTTLVLAPRLRANSVILSSLSVSCAAFCIRSGHHSPTLSAHVSSCQLMSVHDMSFSSLTLPTDVKVLDQSTSVAHKHRMTRWCMVSPATVFASPRGPVCKKELPERELITFCQRAMNP